MTSVPEASARRHAPSRGRDRFLSGVSCALRSETSAVGAPRIAPRTLLDPPSPRSPPGGAGPGLAPRAGAVRTRGPVVPGGAPSPPPRARPLPLPRGPQMDRPRRDVRDLRRRPERGPLSAARRRPGRLRADAARACRRGPHLHAPARLALRGSPGRRTEDPRRDPLGGAGLRLRRPPHVPRGGGRRAGRRRSVPALPGRRARLRDRERDPPPHGPLPRESGDRALPPPALPRGEVGGPRGPRHLRQLSDDRIPRPRVPRLPPLQRLPPPAPGDGEVPRPDADPDQGEAARPRRGRRRLAAEGGGEPGGAPRLDDPPRVRQGVRRPLRLRVDRRVGRRRPSRRRLALRPRRPGAPAEAGPRDRRGPLRRGAARPPQRVAPRLGRRLHLQRRGDARGDARVPRGARLPRVRGDLRRRRLDRPQPGGRPPIRGAHPHPASGEPRTLRRPQRRRGCGERRDRRLHRLGRLRRPRLAAPPRDLPRVGPLRRMRRAQPGAALRRAGRPVHRRLPGQPDGRPQGQRRGRPHRGRQHGVPARRAPRDRGLRPRAHPGGGRRRHRLAAPGCRHAARLQSGGDRLAPREAVAPALPTPAVRLRRGREPAREEAPRALQPRRLHPLGGQGLRQRRPARFRPVPPLRLPRQVRLGAVPDPLPEGRLRPPFRAGDGPLVLRLDPPPRAHAALALARRARRRPPPPLGRGGGRLGLDRGRAGAARAPRADPQGRHRLDAPLPPPPRALGGKGGAPEASGGAGRAATGEGEDRSSRPPRLGARAASPRPPPEGAAPLLGTGRRRPRGARARDPSRAEVEGRERHLRTGVGELGPLRQRLALRVRARLQRPRALRPGPVLRVPRPHGPLRALGAPPPLRGGRLPDVAQLQLPAGLPPAARPLRLDRRPTRPAPRRGVGGDRRGPRAAGRDAVRAEGGVTGNGVHPGDRLLWRRLLRQGRPYAPHLALLLLLGIAAQTLTLLQPHALHIAVDSVIGEHPLPRFLDALAPGFLAGSKEGRLALAVLLLVGTALLVRLQGLGAWLLTTWTSQRMVLDFRARLFRHAQRISLAYHDTKGTTDSSYRILYDAPSIQHLAIDGVLPFLASAASFACMLLAIALLSLEIAAVALAIAPLLFLATHVYGKRIRQRWRSVKKLESASLSIVQEALSAVRVVKAFGREEREESRFEEVSNRGIRENLAVARAESVFGMVIGLTSAIGTAAVLWIGVRRVGAQAMTVGDLLLVMAYLGHMYEPLRTMSKKLAGLQGSLASAERAFELLDEAEEVVERPGARALSRAG